MIWIIHVCLRKGYHAVFEDLIKFPPKNVKYIIPKLVSSAKQSGAMSELKRKAWRIYANTLKRPNAIHVPAGDAELIHSTSGVIPTNSSPWVMDLEHVYSFVGFEIGLLSKTKNQIKKFLLSDYCKQIMPWTNAGKESITNFFRERAIKEKIEVVYPALAPPKIKKKKSNEINLLFISFHFHQKGGAEVLEAFDILKNKYDLNLTVISSDTPSHLMKKFSRYKNVEFREFNVSREELYKKYFANASIFVLPSYMDTFGRVYQEAMSFSVPIISSNIFAIPEIVGDAGILIDCEKYSFFNKNHIARFSWKEFLNFVSNTRKPEIVKKLVKNLSMLVEDSGLRKKMGKEGREEIVKGRFSIKNRNKKLKQIYEAAIGVSK